MPCISLARAVAAVVLRPQGRPDEGLQVDLPLLLGARGHHRRLPGHVEPGADEQGRRRPLPERPRRRCAWGDKKLGFPPRAQEGRLQAHRPGPLPESERRLLEPDLGVQEGERADRHRRPAAARLRHLLEAGAPAGLPPKVASVGKALLFPSAVEALGKDGAGMSTELWWSPFHPYRSSLTRQSRARSRHVVREGDEEAVDAAGRLRPRALRGRGRTCSRGTKDIDDKDVDHRPRSRRRT